MYCSLFRGYKQDRGSIVGAVVALENYLKTMKNPERNVLAPARRRAKWFMKTLRSIPDSEFRILDSTVEGVDPLKIALMITLTQKTPEEVKKLRDDLMSGEPEIWIETKDNSFIINITSFRGLMMFDEADSRIVARRLIQTLRRRK